MSQVQPVKERPSSVVLSDWAANVEIPGMDSLESALYEILLLSLLYDEICIQDEVFALSNKLSQWLVQDKTGNLLRQIFDIGSLVVLSHPSSAYPTPDLSEISYSRPIKSRAEYISKYSTKDEKRFKPNSLQEFFYDQLDFFIREKPGSRRDVGSRRRDDLFAQLRAILFEVLGNQNYLPWINSAFPGFTRSMGSDFLSYLDNPENLLINAKKKGRNITIRRDIDGKIVFDRSLFYQASDLYSPIEAKAMQKLIQSCFAALFCRREDAVGRYGQSLTELLILPDNKMNQRFDVQEFVTVEASVDVNLPLPKLDHDFVKAVRTVREDTMGKKLRETVRKIGEHVDFNEQIEAWRAVSDTLANIISPFKKVVVRNSLITYGKRAVAGAIIGGITSNLMGDPVIFPKLIGGALISEGIGIISDHVYEFARTAFINQRVREQLENILKIRCTSLAIPPLPLNKVI